LIKEFVMPQFSGNLIHRMTLCVLALVALVTEGASGGDWASWRGPNHNGIADPAQQPPVTWSERQNVVWKTAVPGRGHSSPTVVGDRIYLATADEANQVQGVLAFDRQTGDQVWIKKLSSGGFPETHKKNTHATCTVACDGERLFVTFHHHRQLTLYALDTAGESLWQEVVGPYHPQRFEYGYAPSPVLYEGSVIVAADVEHGGYLAAYSAEDGQLLWKQERFPLYSFSSPIIAHVAGRDQLLISGCERVCSYDPTSGELLWSVRGTTMATCGTMVWEGDYVFASGGYPQAETICVKADGSGEVAWRNRAKCYEQSMLVSNGHVYAFTDQGVAICWRASDGREMWKKRLGGPVSASPILVGDTIYATNEQGTTFVFKANPQQYKELARNKLGDEGFATMSILDGRIYLRTAAEKGGRRQETLYCLGQ
jgi:outer membrane protein assembly factor BamB